MTATTQELETADYVALVTETLQTNRDAIALWLTNHCTECDLDIDPDSANAEGHTIVDGYVIVGCEGYWLINPAALGMHPGQWTDWLVTAEATEQDAYDSLRANGAMHIEARCPVDGQFFLPNDRDDLHHAVNDDTGLECGALGMITGGWGA